MVEQKEENRKETIEREKTPHLGTTHILSTIKF